MHSLAGTVVVATLSYLGTMFDNFFAFAAQLVVTEPQRHRRVGWSQVTGVATLIIIAASIGSALSTVPLRVVGLLCIAPWALAVRAWRHRSQTTTQQFRRGALATFAITLMLGGDNIAVWIPLLRASGGWHAFVTIVTFALWESIFVRSAQALAAHPRVIGWGNDHTAQVIPWVYVGLGFLILLDCGTL